MDEKELTFSGLNTTWMRIFLFTFPLFLFAFSDSLISFYAPVVIQETVGSSFWMGVIMSFSSFVGLTTDFIFPQILKDITTKRLLVLAGIISSVFYFLLLIATIRPFIILFLLGMGLWGIYYEFLAFSKQRFISTQIPRPLHSGATAFVFVFKGLSYTVGPILASFLLDNGHQLLLLVAIAISLTGLFFSLLMSKKQQMLSRPEAMHLHLGVELSHWAKLFKAVWPMMIIFLLIGLVDAVFWTSGIVLSNNLGKEDVLGKFIVPLYVMPSMLAGTMIARWHPSDKKKKYGTIFFIVSAVFLSLIGFTYNIKLVLLLVGISSVFSSLAYPLIDAVFSDFTQRMGKERFHLIGLTNSAGSIAYIVGPILSGLIASFVGEQMTFSVIGIFVLLVSLFILFITPRKILLPQGDIKNWD